MVRDRPPGRARYHPGPPGHDPASRDAERRNARVKVEIVTKRLEEVPADALVVGLYVGETKLPERLARLHRSRHGHRDRGPAADEVSGEAGSEAQPRPAHPG